LADVNHGVEEDGAIRIGLRRLEGDAFERVLDLEPQIACRILEDRAQLDVVGKQPPEAARRGRPVAQRHKDARAVPGNAELDALGFVDLLVAHRLKGERPVLSGEEPRLEDAIVAHTDDAPTALGQPYLTQTAAEQTALTAHVRSRTEPAEALVHDLRGDTNPVVDTPQFLRPRGPSGQL
jgi:hypothetical protein